MTGYTAAGFEDGRKNCEQEYGCPLETRKGKETNSLVKNLQYPDFSRDF